MATAVATDLGRVPGVGGGAIGGARYTNGAHSHANGTGGASANNGSGTHAKGLGTGGPAAKVKAQPVGEKTYFESMSDYIQDYIPLPIPAVVKAINGATQPAKTVQDDHEQVLWVQFDTGDDGDVPVRHSAARGNRMFLTLGYANGYQLWDVTDGENAREIVSRRTGPIKQHCTRVLLSPLARPGMWDKFAAQRPLMTVVSADDTVGNASAVTALQSGQAVAKSSVRVLSLQTHECVSTLRFRSEIHGVQCNRRIVAVASRECIYAFKAETLENAFSINGCFLSAGPVVNPFALGSRWIAYAASQPAQSPRPTEAARVPTQTAMEVAKDVAKDIASGLYYLGDLGIQRVSSYLSGPGDQSSRTGMGAPGMPASPSVAQQQQQQQQPTNTAGFNDEASMSADGYPSSSADERSAGTVVIRDVVSRKVVTHFRAMRHEISAMAFDPSGQLLVTASNMGHGFNVFQIMPPHLSARHVAPQSPAASHAARDRSAQSQSASASASNSGSLPGGSHVGGSQNGSASSNGGGASSRLGSRSRLNVQTPPAPESTLVRHIYKLHRGITNAVVVDVSFSNDGRWVALSTSRGTTHVFAISPSGGPVDVLTHTAASVANESRRFTSAGLEEVMSQPPPDLISLQSIARIRSPCVPPSPPTPSASDDPQTQQHKHALASTMAAMGGASLSPVAVRFVPLMMGSTSASWSVPSVSTPTPISATGEDRAHHSPDAQSGSQTVLIACAEKGQLLQYRIIPHPPVQRTADQSVLEATARPLKEWTLGRTESWPETEVAVRRAGGAGLKSVGNGRHGTAANGHANGATNGVGNGVANNKAAGEERRWLAGVEISTHTPLHRPLWMGPQFTFKTYQAHEIAMLHPGGPSFYGADEDQYYREEILSRGTGATGVANVLSHHRGTPEDALVIPLRLADAKLCETPPSPHAMDEEDIMLSLSKAMQTTMRPHSIGSSNGVGNGAGSFLGGRSVESGRGVVGFETGALNVRSRPPHYEFGSSPSGASRHLHGLGVPGNGHSRGGSRAGGTGHSLGSHSGTHSAASDDGSDIDFVVDDEDEGAEEDWGAESAFPDAFDDDLDAEDMNGAQLYPDVGDEEEVM